MSILAEIGPWPAVSRLIGFAGRLWFANSVKGRNHNSADIYSYDPKTGETRYERHLFSQDAGRPVVIDGTLYWPFEDPRFSVGFGHFMTTNGTEWNLGVIPTGRIFHTHAMAMADRLIAATSAWQGHLDISTDRGATWRRAYDHPTAAGQVSRIVDLITVGDLTFATLTSRRQRTLMLLRGDMVEPVPGWPSNRSIAALAAYHGDVYGLVRTRDGSAIWKTDGRRSRRVASADDLAIAWNQGVASDLIADARGLWAVTTTGTDGRVWQSGDGSVWTRRFSFNGGRAIELASYRNRIFVGGTDDARGIGLLWGDGNGAWDDESSEPVAAALPPTLPPGKGDKDWRAIAARLDQMLADPAAYQDHGRRLRDAVFDMVRAAPPGGFLAERLTVPMAADELSLIGGAVQVPAVLLGRAILLWGMALGGEAAAERTRSNQGWIPLDFLTRPWTRPANPSEKYFDSQPFALWVTGRVRQDDAATIDALIGRLEQQGDPLWLRGDVVGALTALTGRRFAYDVDGWRRWWSRARNSWPR